MAKIISNKTTLLLILPVLTLTFVQELTLSVWMSNDERPVKCG